MVSLFPVFFPVLAGLAMLDLKISRFKDREKYVMSVLGVNLALTLVANFLFAVVMGIYGYKKEWDHRLLAAGMVVCGAIVWAFFGLGLWYHILINLVAAFIGMYIGEGKRNRKKKAES